MKKLWITATLAASLSSAGYVTAADTGPGCGLGTLLWDGKDGIASHVLAATTNGTSGNQTFGMTTGTLGCQPSASISSTASLFLDENFDNIALDMSRGGGEHLDTLAVLMNIEKTDRGVFKQTLQANFNEIFTKENVTAAEVLDNMANVMQQDEVLVKYLG